MTYEALLEILYPTDAEGNQRGLELNSFAIPDAVNKIIQDRNYEKKILE